MAVEALFLELLHSRPDSRGGRAFRSRGGTRPCVNDRSYVFAPLRQRRRPRKDKGIAFDSSSGDGATPRYDPGFTSESRDVPPPGDFFDELPPAFSRDESLDNEERDKVTAEGARLVNEAVRVWNASIDGSFRTARLARFKAEETAREFAKYRLEMEEQNRRQAEIQARALVRAERSGRRRAAAEMNRRAEIFSTEFEAYKEAQDFVGDFRECRGSVGTLGKMQRGGFSISGELATMDSSMRICANAESFVPPIEGRIRELWNPIQVSEDTADVGEGPNAGDGDEEVDQPDSSFGISLTDCYEFDYNL
ncbi:uncharacterized protein LOC130495857 [Raphanus sativus]|uniref:Uncharacterized protein LOC130495857 n=1 Tax=Raphanus sativus TaxID=3726 RepID=A0A9W3BVU0_RAPSA|nr:uncharacterized protein LOC130495857 [Raphanus sativus]